MLILHLRGKFRIPIHINLVIRNWCRKRRQGYTAEWIYTYRNSDDTHTCIYIYTVIIYFINQSVSSTSPAVLDSTNHPIFFSGGKDYTKNPHADLDQLAPPLDPPTGIACKDKAKDLKVTLRPYIPHRTQAPVSCCVFFLGVFFVFWKDGGDVSSYSLEYQIVIGHNE